MILLDTHIWVWWVSGSPQLTPANHRHLVDNQSAGLGVSVISCWEVAKLVQKQRLILSLEVAAWIKRALGYPGVQMLNLTPEIAVQATMLPSPFHNDPADQIIVATAIAHAAPILTADARILNYPHIQSLT